MSSSLMLHPSGNLSAIHPQQIFVRPIAGASVAIGDIVRFDITANASLSAYTDWSKLEDFDDPKCPFNVVVLSGAAGTGNEGGVWGVVTEAAAAGNRCTVCIHGIVTAKVTAAAALEYGRTLLPAASNVLEVATTGNHPVVAVLVDAVAGAITAQPRKVWFNGYQFGSSAG